MDFLVRHCNSRCDMPERGRIHDEPGNASRMMTRTSRKNHGEALIFRWQRACVITQCCPCRDSRICCLEMIIDNSVMAIISIL